MSDSLFSLSSLAIVTPVVALATYAIVLNLDRITQVFAPPTPATSTSSRSLVQSFINVQARRMKRDHSSMWRARGDAFVNSRLPGTSNRRPSQWRVLQFVARSIFLPIWNALIIVFAFILHTFTTSRKAQRQRTENETNHSSERNPTDIEVQVQVDVNVEKGWASIAAGSL